MKITPPTVRLPGMEFLVELEVDDAAATNRR
jgi:hypothetical protein